MSFDDVPLVRADRVAALQRGADALQVRYPATQCNVIVCLNSNRRNARATWRWPGVVVVTVLETGRLIAQSLPGKPHQLDARACSL